METEHIIKILQLKNLGRKSAFLICDFYKEELIADEHDPKEAVLKFISHKKGRLPLYSKADFSKAFQRGDEIIEESRKRGINITSYYDSDYPQTLKEIDDSPILLTLRGITKG